MNKKIEKELRENIEGEVRADPVSRKVYSVDASIYEIEPLAIVLPKTVRDIQTTVHIASSHKIPLIPRGAATGVTGGCIGKGIVVDLSKYLHNILEINPEKRFAIVEPGVVQDLLNAAVKPFGLHLGPETSTGNRATIGGMVANNAAGAHSLRYGKMVDHVLEVEMVLSNGSLSTFGQETTDNPICRTIDSIRKTYGQEIKKRFPDIPRRVSGYNLDEILKTNPMNLSKLIVGSEGTLGMMSCIKVALTPIPPHRGLSVLHFNTLSSALESVHRILEYQPYSLEMIDQTILSLGKQSPLVSQRLGWLLGNPEAVLVVEFDGETQNVVQQKLHDLQKEGLGYASNIICEPKAMNDVWAVRKAGLEILLSKRSYTRAVAFIEDIAVSPSDLAPFMEKLLPILKTNAGIYGHVGAGCVHIRPYLNLQSEKDRRICEEMMEEVSDLVLEYHGAMSGEHGDGLVRSWLHEKLFGKQILKAFAELKSAFDPHGLMNPGKIVSDRNRDTFLQDTRTQPKRDFSTFLDFSKEGGFSLAADLCNGNGSCRKTTGTMCPSFQATNDEYDTTRARAQALRGAIDGTFSLEKMDDTQIYKVLDLCIECKGCKRECPAQVDMAKMKSEFLYHYHQKQRPSFRSRLFANLPAINKLAPLIRLAEKLPFQSLFGICSQRELPKIQKIRFSKWWKHHSKLKSSKKVVLFNDTFTEYYSPHIGQSAVQVLETLGFEVIIPPLSCCGRTLLSKGFLPKAKKYAEKLVNLLIPYARQNLPILGLEPSCILTLFDDYPSLLGTNQNDAVKVASMAIPIENFLNHLDLKDQFTTLENPIHVHGHCHQKAIVGMSSTIELLSNTINQRVSEIPSGCCGMAGSFGYEQEHYEVSQAIANLVLVPYLKQTSTEDLIVASGFSCRTQIRDFAKREALHPIELLRESLNPYFSQNLG